MGAGRGFVVEGGHNGFVITAAHCLPLLPPCASFSSLEERTYQSLLGQLGKEPTIWAECLFADPIGDIAVLGSPDDQELFDEAESYEVMVNAVVPLCVSEGPASEGPAEGRAWLLSLDGRWFKCNVKSYDGGRFLISDADEPIRGGMSGSPIVAMDGSAIGVVCTSQRGQNGEDLNRGGPNARLFRNLPGWLLRPLRERK